MSTTVFTLKQPYIFQPSSGDPQGVLNCHVTHKMLLFHLILTSGHVFCWPGQWNASVLREDGPLRVETCRRISTHVNKLVLTYISALVGFLCKIVSTVHGYGQYKLTMKFGLLVLCVPQSFDVLALLSSFFTTLSCPRLHNLELLRWRIQRRNMQLRRTWGLPRQRDSGSFPNKWQRYSSHITQWGVFVSIKVRFHRFYRPRRSLGWVQV